MIRRPVLTALALLVVLPVLQPAEAHAGNGVKMVVKFKPEVTMKRVRAMAMVPSASGTTASVAAELESDAGDASLTLEETDAWLHGAATLTALPATKATVSVALYDAANSALGTFSGTLDTDGTVSLAADKPGAVDVEVVAAEVFTAPKGYDLGLDLAGADTYEVAYASVTVTEPGTKTCAASDEKGNCLKWTVTDAVSTRAEVYWDDVGSVWEADLDDVPEALVEMKVTTRDKNGKKLESVKAKLAAPWADGGEGVASLATDEDPLTTLALSTGSPYTYSDVTGYVVGNYTTRLGVVSSGWSAGDELPVDAAVELTNGDTVTVPVNSYQRRRDWNYTSGGVEAVDDWGDRARVIVTDPNTGVATDVSEVLRAGFDAPLCGDGVCATVVENAAGEAELELTTYADDADSLPDTLELTVEVDGELLVDTLVGFDDEITAVFANEVEFVGDAVGVELSGKVSLLGEANRKGKQETLAKGKFYAVVVRDAEGDLELAGADKDEVVSSGGSVAGGEAISLTDREGVAQPPPAIQYGNGSGTKNASHTTSTRPELL